MPLTERRKTAFLWSATGLTTAILVVYSQTLSFTWDEGFHLIAAMLVNAGKRPYLDFLFAQTPLNVYWVASWMRVFGENWRTAHALAAIETAGGAALVADYVYRRFPVAGWRMSAALVSLVVVALNVVVVEYGTLGQAYGICLLLTVAAFRFATVAPGRGSPVFAALAGLAAGASADSSLLTVTVPPVLLIWIFLRNRVGSRWMKAGAFMAGIALGFLPMIWFFLQSPHRVIFDVFKFHLFYRQVWWGGWQLHDLEVFTAWLDCSQAMILGALAIAGVIFVRRSDWDPDVRAEFYLCGWLALTMSAYLMTTHPTFARYFLLAVPFAGILAAPGLYGLGIPGRWPVALLIALTAAGLGRSIYEDNGDSWRQIDSIAKKVADVTPRGAMLYADDPVYFALHWIPPPSMEWNGGHKIDLPMAQAAPLHVLPRAELIRRIKAGAFATVETCGDDEPEALGLPSVYRQKAEVEECFVYWGRKQAGGQ